MSISKGSEVTVKVDYEDLKAGGKYVVASLDTLDQLMWLIGHKNPYPPELFSEIEDQTESSSLTDTLQDILKVLKEINNKM